MVYAAIDAALNVSLAVPEQLIECGKTVWADPLPQ